MKASSVGRGPVSSRATSAAALARAMGAAEARTAPVARIRGEAGVLAAAETPGGAETVVDARDRGPGAVVDAWDPGSGAVLDAWDRGSGAVVDAWDPGSGAVVDAWGRGSGAVVDACDPG